MIKKADKIVKIIKISLKYPLTEKIYQNRLKKSNLRKTIPSLTC